jgi:3-dehydroquinate dehydratase
MNMRGKVQVDIFGPMTLPEYDERIRGYAKELGVEVEINRGDHVTSQAGPRGAR